MWWVESTYEVDIVPALSMHQDIGAVDLSYSPIIVK
jgi:hypothetical protein